MKEKEGPNRVLLSLAIALIIILSLFGMIYVKEFVGWFYHTASAGSITALIIHQVYRADAWHGFAGTAILDYANTRTNWNQTVQGANSTLQDLNFNCFGKSGFDLYASTVPKEQLDLSTIQPATVADIDAYIGIDPLERMSATSTFNETFTINLGGVMMTGPGIRTKALYNNNTFHQVALKDGDGHLFFGANATTAIPGFDGMLHNYQMMVPVPYNQTSITYYFFPDPVTDILGACMEWSYAPLDGYVTDSSTGLPMANVTVQVGDAITQTNDTGQYSLLAMVGTNFLIGYKRYYFDYVNFTTVAINGTNQHNFSMIPTYNQTSPTKYGFIEGNVFDGTTGLPVENATVVTGIFSYLTDEYGNYSLISPESNNTMIIAMKTGYRANITYVNVTAFNTTYYNITILLLPAIFGPNGTVYGKAFDNTTNETLANATVYIGSWSAVTNETGDYSMIIPSYEFYYIIAMKELYNPYVGNLSGNLSVTGGSTINYDVYLNPSHLLDGLFNQPPGDVGPYTEPPGIEATSNETQQLTQPGTENGTGLIIRDEQGKIAAYLTIRQIRAHLKQDSFVEQTISFYNFQKETMSVELAVEGEEIKDIFEIDSDEISVTPNNYGDLGITIMGTKPPGLYKGNLLIKGAINTTLPVEIRISKEGKIPIKTLMMKLDVLKSEVVQGNPVQYKLDLVNLFTDRKYEVNLKFYVADINGTKKTNVSEKTIMLETFTSLVGQIEIPDDFVPGDYIVRAQADYLGLTSTVDALFTVREPFYAYDLMGILPVWLLATLIALVATSLFAGQEIKRRQEAKKRFHAKLEYDLIPQDGPRSLFVGNIAETNKRAYIDMDVLTVHSIVAGSTGGGKSISAQDIIEEALIKGTAVAVFDPTAQWSGMLRKLEDKKFLEFYSQFGMDAKKDPRGFNGNIKAVKNGREIIDIFKYLKPGEIQIFTTNTLDPKDYDIFVASMIQQIFHSKLDEFRGLKYMIVFDEIHRILPKFGGSGAGFTQIERGCREFRKWGIGIVLISQVLGDFVGEIKANINTQVQMKTRDEGDLNRIKMQYGEEYIQSLVKSPVGSGMLQNSNWNRGRPYYVTFRPILHSVVRLTDEELDKYNKYNAIVDQLEFEFDQLEGLKQDVFDLRLELKLAKDKIKTGNFNMVQIYLDGLTPRVQKMWDKLGKKPEAIQIKLLDTAEINAAVKKAQEEKAKKEGGAQAAQETPTEAAPQESAPQQPAQQEQPKQEQSPATQTQKPTQIMTAAAKPVQQAPQQARTAVPPSGATQFSTLVARTRQTIAARNKTGATQLYSQLSSAYKTLPPQYKNQAYSQIMDINKQISMLR